MSDRIRFHDVRLGFGEGRRRVEVLDGVDFSVEEGEFVSVLGPSGCGKSTLLRLMMGLIQPTEGTVTFDGADLATAMLALLPPTLVVLLMQRWFIKGLVDSEK